jgi:tetratricopeptide (TPR) repeat protein
VFEDIGDLYGQSAVRMERGLCWLLHYEELRYADEAAPMDECGTILRRALADLERAVELCALFNKQELPKALHELGHVHWEQGRPDLARTWWDESLRVARDAGNLRYVLENEIGMSELDVEAAAFDKALTHRSRIEPLYEATRRSHQLLWSRLRKLEEEALYGLGDYDAALSRYRDAMPELARHGGWGRYRLDFELRGLLHNIAQLPADEAQRWVQELNTAWPLMIASGDIPSQQAAKLVAAVTSGVPSSHEQTGNGGG